MKIKLIDFGVPEHQRPYRPHGNDAGADVYLPYDCTLQPGEIAKIPLGFPLRRKWLIVCAWKKRTFYLP